MFRHYLSTRAICLLTLALVNLPGPLPAQANMRRDGALTLIQTNTDNHGFYGATIDPSNGFAYFASRYVYKVNIRTPLPTQVGTGIYIGSQSYSGAMDASAGCAYFASGTTISQILANGTNAPQLGSVMASGPFGGSAYVSQVLIDTTDPANHYLYAMTVSGSSSTLYKIALNNYPNSGAVIGSASTIAPQPSLGYGTIDLTNRCAYFGTFVPSTNYPYVVKFALGNGASGPTNLGGVALDPETNRSVDNIVLDIPNGYGYCDSDGNDLLFGHGRVYKWALNGTGTPTLVAYVDMHTNEGYCHVSAIKPAEGLLYYSSDLSYPAFVYRYRLPTGTNAPVETGNIPLLASSYTPTPAWGYNPTVSTNWGEVFSRSLVYDPVGDFVYIGRDYADAQVQPYTDQIVKIALDRDESLLSLTEDVPNTNNTIPYSESFEEYTNGQSLVGANGWYGEDTAMALISTNADTYAGIFPIDGPDQLLLQVNGAVTNRFSPSPDTNVWLDMVLQAKYWTDPLMLTLSNTPFALCITTNGQPAVWNCTNPPAPGDGWTALADTSIASNQFFRLTLEVNYNRDANNEFYYRVWVNGAPSVNPQTWYAAADTNQNYLGDIVALGRFAMDDLVVTVPVIAITNVTRNSDGSASVSSRGLPGFSHRVWAATNVAQPVAWQLISTNTAGADGTWQFNDTADLPARYYRASLP